MFSGGKDSTACFLRLLDLKIPKRKIELWHHLVDGRGEHLMDWECTEDYCRKFAAAFNVPIYFSWKEGGFKGEMLRENQPTKPNYFETPEGISYSGGKGKQNTRLLFPQLSEDLRVRWCSSYLKIDVGKTALINQLRFEKKRILILSGERAEESRSRSHYAFLEPDKSDNRNGTNKIRHVDRCRIIHSWKEQDVWKIIERYQVIVHPCYYLGYKRCSCKWCIFASPDQVATSAYLSPYQFRKLLHYEKLFRKTIHPGIDLKTYEEKGTVFKAAITYFDIAAQSINHTYPLPIFTKHWVLPAGATVSGNFT